jgi:ribosome-binding factor A
MKPDRIQRINVLLKREIGETLFQIMGEESFDLAAVTVTRVAVSRNLRRARVFVSIRDHGGERDHMLRLLERHRPEIQARINRDLVLKYTPRLSFELDTSVERGDRMLQLLDELEREHQERAAEMPESPDAGGNGNADAAPQSEEEEAS